MFAIIISPFLFALITWLLISATGVRFPRAVREPPRCFAPVESPFDSHSEQESHISAPINKVLKSNSEQSHFIYKSKYVVLVPSSCSYTTSKALALFLVISLQLIPFFFKVCEWIVIFFHFCCLWFVPVFIDNI
jgi:hypothetical protein